MKPCSIQMVLKSMKIDKTVMGKNTEKRWWGGPEWT